MSFSTGGATQAGANSYNIPEPFVDMANLALGMVTRFAQDGVDAPGNGSGTGSWRAPEDGVDAMAKVEADFEKIKQGIMPDGMDPKEFSLMMLQKKIADENRQIAMMTNLMAMHFETLKKIVDNMR
jgi:hypothetical protein